MIITIDGPAGAGKSSIAKALSNILNFQYIDSGAMFRAVAYMTTKEGIDIYDCHKVERLSKDINISFNKDRVLINGEDITDILRQDYIGKGASIISTYPLVRKRLLEMQRLLAKDKNIVMDGRDIGTVIFPEAEFKFYLTADIDERAKRRYLELISKGMKADLTGVRKEILIRDQQDSTRETAPLRKALDAIEIDTTSLTIDEVVNFMLKRINISL